MLHRPEIEDEAAAGVTRPTLGGRLARFGRMVLQLVVPLLVLAAALAGYQYLKATKPEIAKRAPTETTYAVSAVTVSRVSVAPQITAYGTTAEGRQVQLRALVAGRVVETGPALRDGAIASKGDMLIRIDPFDFETRLAEAKAQAAEAEARLAEMKASRAAEKNKIAFIKQQLELAKTDLSRAQPLARRGAVSGRTVDERQLLVVQREQTLEQSQNQLDIWTARIAQQESSIARLAIAVQQAERRLKDTTLRAPFDGYVSDVSAQVGRMMSVNDTVANLIDRDRIDAKFSLSNEQYGQLASTAEGLVGRAVTVLWQAGDKTVTYEGEIERVGARVTASTGGVDIFARVKAPTEPIALRPGTFVTVTLAGPQLDDVVRLPAAAVYDGKRTFAIAEGRLVARDIRIVGVDGRYLLVKGDLKAGEQIVTTRLSAPGTGVRVNVVKQERGNGA